MPETMPPIDPLRGLHESMAELQVGQATLAQAIRQLGQTPAPPPAAPPPPDGLFDSPVGWLLVVALLLSPLSFFLLGRSFAQRLQSQHDELKRQRLRLEGIEESLRGLPKNAPQPSLDVEQLADQLREHLSTPVEPAPDASTPASLPPLPFYQNSHWLPGACEGPRAYLDHLRTLRSQIAALYDELSEADEPGEALALCSWMLSRFHERQQEVPEDRWHHLLLTAEETGFVGDRSLSERLSQARSDEEAARTLHRALYREVLEKSISHHLILLEEWRHLPNFCGGESSYGTCKAIASQVDPMVEPFLNATRRLAGYTPNHVALFSDFTDEAAQFLRNHPSERLPGVYRHLQLPRRQVLCVLAYGLRRERGWENEETQVILS